MGAVKPMVRLPSTNSRIWSNVSRSMFCMVMFIHPQHGTLFRLSCSGSSRIGNNLPLRARPALETNHRFRLIPHWTILSRVFGALRWYHRAEVGANPAFAELYEPIIRKYLE